MGLGRNSNGIREGVHAIFKEFTRGFVEMNIATSIAGLANRYERALDITSLDYTVIQTFVGKWEVKFIGGNGSFAIACGNRHGDALGGRATISFRGIFVPKAITSTRINNNTTVVQEV